jgi:DsbC/DsbD-like thiol-disulfide interchange protein
MNDTSTRLRLRIFLVLTITLLIAATSVTLFIAPTQARNTASSSILAPVQPNVGVGWFYATDKAQRGRTTQAAVVLDIPNGLHVNSNRPLGKYAVPTVLKVEAPNGVRVSPVIYPRSIVRRFKFSDEQLAVFEGRTVMRFNVTLPANYPQDAAQVRARVRFQSCTDEVCYPPVTRDVEMNIGVVGANDAVRRVNTSIFGGSARRGGKRG